MPQIVPVKRSILKADPTRARDFGDLTYLATLQMILYWKANPRWTTIHQIYQMLPAIHHRLVWRVGLDWFNTEDIEKATDLAFFEFYRVVAARYEDKRGIDNKPNVFVEEGVLVETEGGLLELANE